MMQLPPEPARTRFLDFGLARCEPALTRCISDPKHISVKPPLQEKRDTVALAADVPRSQEGVVGLDGESPSLMSILIRRPSRAVTALFSPPTEQYNNARNNARNTPEVRTSLEAAGVPRDFHDGLISAGLDLETLQLLVQDQMVHSHTVLKEAGVAKIGDRVRIVSAIRAGLSGGSSTSVVWSAEAEQRKDVATISADVVQRDIANLRSAANAERNAELQKLRTQEELRRAKTMLKGSLQESCRTFPNIVFVEPGLHADTSVPLRQFNKPVSLRMPSEGSSQPEVGSTISIPQSPNPPQSRGTCKYCQLAVTLAHDRGRNEDGAYFHMSCLPVPAIQTLPTTVGGDKTVKKSTDQPVSLKMETVRETSSQPEVQALQKLHYGQMLQGYEPPPPGWAQRLLELQDLVADMSYLSASAPDPVARSPPARRDSRGTVPETKPENWTSRSAASLTSHETQNAFAAVLPQGYGPPPPGYGAYGYSSGTG